MNGMEEGSELPRDGSKTAPQNCTTTVLQEDDLLSPSRRSKRLQKDNLPGSKESDLLPVNAALSSEKVLKNNGTTQVSEPSEKSCCSSNFHSESSEYLFGLYDQESEISPNLSHKFYGCKRKGYPSLCGESFALPDDPIYSNSPLFLDRTRKSSLDIDLADPWDISVLDLEYLDQPWLVEYPEVITPYWDVESLLQFQVEDIRQKIEPEYEGLQQRNSSVGFNISRDLLNISAENDDEADSVFTSTPLKNQSKSLSVVSTINITNGQDNNVNIAVIKDEVLKALEEAIKSKSTIGNIDMKIQIVTSDLKSPITSPKQSSVEVRINENMEMESCRSSSSSKENYFVENLPVVTEKSKNLVTAKDVGNVTLSDLNEDWQDSPGSDINNESQDELDNLNIPSSSEKSKKRTRNRKKYKLGVRRSLRTRESNISTINDREAPISTSLSTSNQLVLEENSLSSSMIISKTLENRLEDISLLNEVESSQTAHFNSISMENQADSKRILRSSNQLSDKKDDSAIDIASKNNKTIKDVQSIEGKHDGDTFVHKEYFTKDTLQLSQNKDGVKLFNKSKRKNKFANVDSQLSQDESDSSDAIGRNRDRVRRTFRIREPEPKISKNSAEEPNRRDHPLNVHLQTSQSDVDFTGTNSEQGSKNDCILHRDNGNTSEKSDNVANCQSCQDAEKVRRGRRKKNKIPDNEDPCSSQDESDIITKKSVDRSKRIDNESLSTQSESDVSKSDKKLRGRKIYIKEDFESSQDGTDVTENNLNKADRNKLLINNDPLSSDGNSETNASKEKLQLDRSKRKGRFRNNESQGTQSESDISTNVSQAPRKDILQSSQTNTKIDYYIGKKFRRRKISLKEDLESSQDEGDIGKKIDLNRKKRNKLLIDGDNLTNQDTGKKKTDVGRSRIQGRLHNNESQLTQIKNVLGYNNDLLQLDESGSNTGSSIGKKLRGRNISTKDLQSIQDESDVSQYGLYRTKKRGRSSKVTELEKLKDLLIATNCEIPNRSSETSLNSTKDVEDNELPFKRILRSSTLQSKQGLNQAKEGRRRTFSTSESEKVSTGKNNSFLPRRRSVSANFDNKTVSCTSIRRSLRSQVAEPTKVPFDLKSPVSVTIKNTAKATENIKSPKISFNLTNSFKESHRKFDTDTPIKSILKNVYDSSGRLIGVKVHREKHVKMPSALHIKPEDEIDDTLSKKRLAHQGIVPTKLELNLVKKEEEECLRENGITSRIKIVISPLEIKEETEDTVSTACSVLPLAAPKSDPSMLRKSGQLSNIVQESISGETVKSVEVKEVKIEETCYSLGNFVWAQVGKYPFWPAIICNDPLTQTFQKEVIKQNMAPKNFYHIRFFGDHGRRAWVFRKHIMLYCSDQDLEQIANKLKSENKNYNTVRPYLLTGSLVMIEKWHKAVEELNLLKTKKYNDIMKHMLESYKNHLNNRKKRKLNDLYASSESESEEPDASGNKRKKKFRGSEYLHITADTQLDDNSAFQTNAASEGFDEINITMGVQNFAEANAQVENAAEKSSHTLEGSNETSNKLSDRKYKKSFKDSEVFCSTSTPILSELEKISDVSDKLTPRRSRRSLKPVDSVSAVESLDNNLDVVQQATGIEVSQNFEIPNESAIRLGERRSLRVPKIPLENESFSGQNGESEKFLSKLNKKQTDERSEAESKSSSDSNMYSFEYQAELHKKNNVFNGLTKVKVCDYCLKPGDLYKCKGKCGGFFHLECASKVTLPRNQRKVRKREKSPSKAKIRNAAPSSESTPESNRIEEPCRTRNQCQVQIITIKSKHAIGTPKKVNLPANFDELSLSEQIDYGMKEMMSKFENRTIYADSTDSSSEEGSIIATKNKQLGILDSPASSLAVESEKSAAKSSDLEENGEEEKTSEVSTLSDNVRKSKLIKHVTADSVILTEDETPVDITNVKCTYCRLERDPPCFACGLEVSRRGVSIRRKCSQFRCGRFYHPYCLKMWPQTQWSIGKWSRNQEQEDSFTCPAHTCHTCFSEELGSTACRLPGDKLARCVLCPAGFHTTTFCIPAGTDILGGSQIICPRHRPKATQPINTIWCFICSEGGNLVCCDTCPTSVHPECQPVNLTDDDKYICEDCESGRFPLYDEIVWVKLGQYRWWPALVLFPNEIPENVRALKHQRGDFAVRFFGTNDHYWVNKARSFLFQEGDRGGSPGEGNKSKNKVYEMFGKAIEDAALAYKLKKEFKLRREAESIDSLKPPTYVKINKNKPVGNVKSLELDLSNATACECDPKKPHPCGPDTNCINRLLMTECDPDVCAAGSRCRNQAFQRREYPPMIPYKTQGRGWGLKCLAPIKKGQFVIEYVGELIDSEEYQRRIQKMHEQKEENYYFMTVDSDRMIDAGPKGNLSRFMNHCCDPNCVTQKWTARGDTRVGLFAKCNVESGSELTFNYNLEVVGQEKKVCKCGAKNCSGFIGVKAKLDKPEKPQADHIAEPTEQRRPRKYNKKRAVSPPLIPPCFMCGRKRSDLTCNNKFCNKGYHLKCLNLEEMPEVVKFTCPRHNCNICSNRTIRCCVKCTNSFCPSHSEGNVRHDKFLGFVCRLHDPGISSTEVTSVAMKERAKSNFRDKSTNFSYPSKNRSITSYPPEEREAIREAWRVRKKQEYDRKRMAKLSFNGNARKNPSVGKKRGKNKLKQKAKTTLAPSFSKTLKRSSARNGATTNTIYKPNKQKSLGIKKYKRNLKNGESRIEDVLGDDRELRRAMWRESKRLSRLRQKENLKNTKNCDVQNIIVHTQDNEVTREDNETNNQENHLTNNQQKSISDMEVSVESDDAVEAIQGSSTTEQEFISEDTVSNIQNSLVTSENHDGTTEPSDVTQSERSEFEPIKSNKRRRQKPDSTDEAAVSSTTSDEDSCLKSTPSQNVSQKDPPNAYDNDLEREDPVSSTPPKEPAGDQESKESQENNGVDASDDELTLDKRIKRRSGVRNPRKKIRINVKSFVFAAKTS